MSKYKLASTILVTVDEAELIINKFLIICNINHDHFYTNILLQK